MFYSCVREAKPVNLAHVRAPMETELNATTEVLRRGPPHFFIATLCQNTGVQNHFANAEKHRSSKDQLDFACSGQVDGKKNPQASWPVIHSTIGYPSLPYSAT